MDIRPSLQTLRLCRATGRERGRVAPACACSVGCAICPGRGGREPNGTVVAQFVDRGSDLARTLASVLLASLVALALAPAAQAATSTNAWLAKVGSSGANGTAAVNAFTTGVGNVVLKLKKLPASQDAGRDAAQDLVQGR